MVIRHYISKKPSELAAEILNELRQALQEYHPAMKSRNVFSKEEINNLKKHINTKIRPFEELGNHCIEELFVLKFLLSNKVP